MVLKAKLSSIAPIFNLIQDCSAGGYFNSIYSQPRYQAGLAIQLFSVWLFGKIRLPDGIWYKASLHVIHQEGVFAGFAFMRFLVPSGASQEIYMCAVKDEYRGNGLGRRLIQSVLAGLDGDTIIEAECLPKAAHMKRLLCGMGFKLAKSVKTVTLTNAAKKFGFVVTRHDKLKK